MFQVFQILMFIDGFLMWNLIGQGVLAALLGEARQNNVIYKIIAAFSAPVTGLIRAILPGEPSPFTLGMVSLFFLFILRIAIYMIFFKMGWIPVGITEPAAS